MEPALQQAIDALRIHDVYLRRGSAYLAEGFDPKYDSALDELVISFKHFVRRFEVLELDSNGEQSCLFRVSVELGARWSRPATADDTDGDEPVAQVEATMVAEYRMQDDPGEDALAAFARNNASYHIWPYWREYLSAQCLRMNMPKVTLPTTQVASNRDNQ